MDPVAPGTCGMGNREGSMRLRSLLWGGLLGAAVIVWAQGLPPGTDPPPAEERTGPSPLHRDPAANERALLDATLGFVRSDLRSVRLALDAIERDCRRLDPDDSSFPRKVADYDKAFHAMLDRARELAARGEGDKAFEQFFYIQRACRDCHGLAREAGLLPVGKRAASAGGEAPTR